MFSAPTYRESVGPLEVCAGQAFSSSAGQGDNENLLGGAKNYGSSLILMFAKWKKYVKGRYKWNQAEQLNNSLRLAHVFSSPLR